MQHPCQQRTIYHSGDATNENPLELFNTVVRFVHLFFVCFVCFRVSFLLCQYVQRSYYNQRSCFREGVITHFPPHKLAPRHDRFVMRKTNRPTHITASRKNTWCNKRKVGQPHIFHGTRHTSNIARVRCIYENNAYIF